MKKIFAFSRYKSLIATIALFLLTFSHEIVWQANLIWNPNYLPFFLLIYIFIIFWIFDNQRTLFKRKLILASILSGILVSFMMSLHAVSIFILPLFSFIFGFFFVKDIRKQFFVFSGLGWFITSLPYFISEFTTKFNNTKQIIIFFYKSNVYFSEFSFLDMIFYRLHNILLSWFNIISTIYLPSSYGTFVSLVGIISLAGFFVYPKKTKPYIQILSILVVMYLFIHSSSTGIDHLHYIYFAYFLPPIGFFNFLFYLNNRKYTYIIIGIMLCVMSMGLIGNIKKLFIYSQMKYGIVYRSLNTQDNIDILEIAKSSKIRVLCIPEKWDDRPEAVLNYYKTYIVRVDIRVTKDCTDQNKKLLVVSQNNGYPQYPIGFDKSGLNLIKSNPAYQLYETK